MFDVKLNKYMSHFHLLEVVGRGSETQLQVGEQFKLYSALSVNAYVSGVCRKIK